MAFDPSTAKPVAAQDAQQAGQPKPAFDPKTARPIESPGLLRGVADTALSVAGGAVGATKAISDGFEAGTAVSGGLDKLGKVLAESRSEMAQAKSEQFSREMQDAGSDPMAQLRAVARGIARQPLDMLAGAAGSLVPTLAAGRLGAKAGLGSTGQTAAMTSLGTLQGAGAVKGSIYETVKNEAEAAGMAPEEANALAQQAQAFTGQNAGQIALGAGLGALASGVGVEPAIARLTAGKAAQSALKPTDTLRSAVLKGGSKEALTEGAQAGQETFAGNVAAQREGFDVDSMRGVVGSAALEGTLGGVMGGGVGALENVQAQRLAKLRDQLTAQPGPNSSAAVAAIDTGAAQELMSAQGAVPPMPAMPAQAPEAPTQAREPVPAAGFSEDQEARGLAAQEAIAKRDLDGIKAQGRADKTGFPSMPRAAQQTQSPGTLDAETRVTDMAPFADRVMTLRESLADNTVREGIRSAYGLEALREAMYFASVADRPDIGMPEATRDRMLQVAEMIVQGATVRPINRPGLTAETQAPAARIAAAPAALRIGLDMTPTGVMVSDELGNTRPQNRAEVISAEQRAREAEALGQGVPRGQARPGAGFPRLPFDNTPTGTIRVDGQGQAAPETRSQVVGERNVAQALAERRAQARREAMASGLTPDVIRAQEQRAASAAPILNREGKPFTTRIAANRKAAEVGGEVEKVEGGFIVNPPTPSDAAEVTPPASPVPTQAAPDVPGARAGEVEADGVDLSHLRALEFRLSNERERLDRAKSPSERRAREVTVRGILREIEGERKLLGIPDQQAQEAEDDALLDALDATQGAPEPGASQGAGRDTEPTSTTPPQAQAVTPAEGVGATRAEPVGGGVAAAGDDAATRGEAITAAIERAKRRLRDNRNKQAATGVRQELSKLKSQEQDIEREIRSLRQKAVADEPALANAPEKTLDEQLADLNNELENQGQVQNANARAKRDRIREQIAERDFPEILQAVDGAFNVAEELNAAFKYAGDEPKAKTIARIFKKRGITDEYAKRWTERLLGADAGQADDTMADPEMAAYEVGKSGKTRAQDKAKVAEDAARAKAQADLDAALGDLGDIFGKNTRLTMMPEQEQKLLPVLTRVLDAAFRLGYYKFKDAARFALQTIRAKLGAEVADQLTLDHLQGAYIGMAGKYQDKGADTKRAVIEVESLAELEEAKDPAPAPTPAPTPAPAADDARPSLDGAEGRKAVAQSVADRLVGGEPFATIVEARKFVAALTGQKVEPGTRASKMADEAVEMGVAIAARDIVRAARKQGRSDEAIYKRLLELYEAQPSLNVRDSDSIRNQAYSTPAPLAFVASRLAKIKAGQKVGEPTAGNGMLVMEVAPENVALNELNPDRAGNLAAMGFTGVSKSNAATTALAPAKSLDAVVMNPPFGVVRNEAGDTIKYEVAPSYTTGEVDHAIVFKALESMKDDGNAVLIIGGTLAESVDGRKEAYRGKAKREFFYNLHQQYNVVDHFTVGGDLYKKQGTTYPVDVIVIRGRGPSARALPAANLPPIIETWAQLQEKLNADFGGVGARGPGDAGRDRVEDGQPVDPGFVPEPSRLPAAADGNGSQPGGSDAGAEPADGGRAFGGSDAGRGTSRSDAAVGEPSGSEPTERVGDSRPADGPAPSASQQPSGRRGAAGNDAADVGQRTGGRADRARLSEEDASKLQVKYSNFSGNRSVNTLVPTSHLSALENAFENLRKRVGPIDTYVRDRLQYDEAGFKKAFSAEQVEALALAIDNIERGRGFIIGDQTGIGKGRVVAAMIRYAKLNGKTPVFVTQMPDLYGDMMRDLNDIGMAGFKPLMTNNNASVPLDAEALDWFTETQGIKTRIAELEDAIADLVAADLKGPVGSDELASAVKKAMRASTNPEVVSLRDEIADLKEAMPKKRGKFLDTPSIDKHEAELARMVAEGGIGDYGAIFTTYNQMAALDSGAPKRAKDGTKIPASAPKFAYRNTFLDAMVNQNAMLILDESHNAGEAGDGKFPKVGDKVRALVAKAGSAFYSSATFAKNPAVMDVYSKTDLGRAFTSPDQLANAIRTIPQQQVASAMLVEAGQYIRRERSFDGIEYKTQTVDSDTQAAEDVSTAMRLVVEFDEAKKTAIQAIQNDLDAEGAVMSSTGGGMSSGAVTSTNFTGVMHNVVNTFLLALKADAAADVAIDAIKRGEKPVLTVANTMELFITDYAQSAGLGIGSELKATFADVLMRYLEKTRMARIKHANGDEEVVRLSDRELGPDGVQAYESAREFIQQMNLSIPLSPIDHIKERIRAAGYVIGEVTGRQTVVEGGVIRPRNKAELNTAGKKNTIAKFNGGQIDALIINRSGSTGLSMHASETFADQRRRVMVIAQAELDINNHMQMLGRTNRTGQVTQAPAKLPNGPATYGLPRYVQLSANVPIELRPAAVLAAKMAGLNANTTAGRKSAVEDSSALDFMNKYGDEVAASIVGNDAELNQRLGWPVSVGDSGAPISMGAAARVTGRIGLLPLREQSAIYERINNEYRDLIAQLDAMGRNDLEAKTYPLEAKAVSTEEVAQGDDTSPFTAPVVAERMEVRKLGKPYTSEKVRDLVSEALAGKTADQHRNGIIEQFRKDARDEVTVLQAEAAKATNPAAASAQLEKRKQAMQEAFMRFTGVAPRLGEPVVIKTSEGNIYGVPISLERKKGAKSVTALSSWQVSIAVVDGARVMRFPLSQVFAKDGESQDASAVVVQPASVMNVVNADRTGFDEVPVIEAFDRGQTDARELRTIMTGNLLRASAAFPGRLVSFTTADGAVRQGLLTPATFDLKAAQAKMTPELSDPAQIVAFLEAGGRVVDRETGGEILSARKIHKFEISTAKTGKGKKIATDAGLYMVSSGSRMRANVWPGQEDTRETLRDFFEKVLRTVKVPLTTSADTKDILPGAPPPAFSRTPTQTQPLAVQSAVDRIKATWANAPKVNVVSSMQDPAVPEKVRAEDAKQRQGGAKGSPRGFFYEGEVYVVADAIRSEADVAIVMAHEALGHFGLRQTFGPGLGRVLDLIASSRPDLVSAKAKAYGLPVNVLQARRILAARGITGEEAAAQAARMVQQARATAAEEVLAEMAEKRPNLGIVRRAVAAIRTWLRENIPGMADLKLSDAEIIRDFILPARQFVERGGAQMRGGRMPLAFQRGAADGDDTDRAFTETERAYGGRAAYDRARAAGQTNLTYGQWVQVRTPKFKAWFGDWEALRSNEDANAAIQRWAGGEMKSGEMIQMGRPSEVLQRFGVPDLPIHLTQRVLSKAVRQKHDVDVADLKDLALNIQAPLAVFASKHGASHRVLVTEARHADGNVIVALELAKVRGGLEVNDITSIHPKRDGSIANWLADGLLLGYAKGNGRDWLENSAGSNSQQPQAKAAIDGVIVYDVSRVSNASKVLDPDTGEPMVVFHGTRNSFDRFTKVGDDGIYFTSNPKLANLYAKGRGGNVVPVYVSLPDPQVFDSGTQRPQDWWDTHREVAGKRGAIVRSNSGEMLVVAFRPEQIKSATGNRGTFDGGDPDIRFSRTLGEAVSSAPESASPQGKAIFAEAVKRAAGMGRNRLDVALNLLTRRQITEVYGKDIPELATYNELVQQMDAEKNEVGASADKLADAWGKLKDAKELAELMHDATLAQTDPALPFESFARESAEETSARATKHKELAARYAALSDGAKAVYRGARDQYNDQYRKIKEAIRQNVMRASMTPSQRESFLKRLDEDFFKSVRGVYFPLARFGDYMVNVRGQDGELVAHHRAETLNEAEALRATLMKQAEANGWKVGKVLKAQEFNARRDLAGKGFVGRVMDTLEQAKVSDEVVDAIGQLYLQSLPDLSWAKSGIHRKGTPGFSQDARRAFARNMFFGARHLARLRYADRMTDTLADMQARVNSGADDEAFDSVAAQKVVDHMNRRHDTMMNPQTHPLSTALTSLGFVWHLGLSPASAIVNLTQTAFVSAPLMGARFGWSKAAPAMLEAARLAAVNRNDLGRVLKGDELRAFKEAVNAGTIDVTQAHDLAGIAQGEDSGVLWKIRPVMKAASFLFHHAERLNRQTTFLAAYRLARAEGLDHEAAMQEATGQVYDGHFDYAASNRAMAMQGNVARVVLLFKQYAQAMIYTLSRQTYLSLKGLTPEERSKARKTLAGILAMHAAAAGVLGLPVVGPVLALASALGSEDDEPWDAEVAMRNMLADSIGPELADAVARGGSRLGPWDISGRTGLNNLLIPDIQEGLEGARWYETMAVALMGPVMGIGLNAAKGLQDIAEGETLRGLESMVPAVARAPIKATRYATEGNVDRTGVVINDEISASGLIGQFIGFSPSEARRATEGRAAQMQFASRLQKRRGALMRAHVDAALMGDQEALAEARQDIDAFNRANPDYSIRPANLRQSMIARRRRIAQAEAGAYVPARIRDRAQEQGRFALTE